jgi:hypothetical protein
MFSMPSNNWAFVLVILKSRVKIDKIKFFMDLDFVQN